MRFNPANAREMAARSVVARKQAKAEQLAASAAAPLQADAPTDLGCGVSIACVRMRLEELNEQMAKARGDDKRWDNLSRSFDRLFKVWMVLSATPGSGVRKYETERRQSTKGVAHLLGISLAVPPVVNQSTAES